MCSAIVAFAETRELLLEPGFERQHQGLAAFLANGATLIGTAAADRLLDRIESRDARQRLAGDRRGAALGVVVEATSQMSPAKGERDRLVARGAGNGLISRVSIALHDAAMPR
jgi:hypothetical protein